MAYDPEGMRSRMPPPWMVEGSKVAFFCVLTQGFLFFLLFFLRAYFLYLERAEEGYWPEGGEAWMAVFLVGGLTAMAALVLFSSSPLRSMGICLVLAPVMGIATTRFLFVVANHENPYFDRQRFTGHTAGLHRRFADLLVLLEEGLPEDWQIHEVLEEQEPYWAHRRGCMGLRVTLVGTAVLCSPSAPPGEVPVPLFREARTVWIMSLPFDPRWDWSNWVFDHMEMEARRYPFPSARTSRAAFFIKDSAVLHPQFETLLRRRSTAEERRVLANEARVADGTWPTWREDLDGLLATMGDSPTR